MQKRWYFPKGEFIFPIAGGRIKPLGGDQDLRTSTLVRQRAIQGESNIDFLGESEGSLPPPHDAFPDAGEAINDFWSMSGNFIYRHHVEQESNFTRREKNHSLFHWNTLMRPELLTRIWMLSRRSASMIIGISMGQETCLVLGHVSLNSLWRLTKRQATSRPDHLWPELWRGLARNAKLREKQKVVKWETSTW